MAKVTRRPPASRGGEVTLDLCGPGMTALHRVGLAGLWMTLTHFEADGVQLPGGRWELTARRVTLRWENDPRPFFASLFTHAFKVHRKGLLWFAALGNPMDHPQAAVMLQGAILGTFLQHGRTRQADPAHRPTGALAVEIDDTPLPLTYQKVSGYAHQTAYRAFLGADGRLRLTRLAGWHFPGGTVRHVGLGQKFTALAEPPERVLPLLFAPVGGIYFHIRRRGEGVRPLVALVIPEIADLAQYAEVRAVFLQHGVKDLLASGTADAGWRVLATLQAKGVLGALGAPSCRVISFGAVPWSKQQKTRVELFTVHAGAEERLRTFQRCSHVLAPRLVRPEDGAPFWDVSQTPDLIARNLAEGHPWYKGFADFVADRARRGHIFRYEKGGLQQMVTAAGFAGDREHVFVQACQEAWRRRLGHLGERARREGASFHALVAREFERLRAALARCRNATTLRETLTDFWARAGGPLPGLQSGWQEILPLLGEKHWRTAKDLALLALASYQPASTEEAAALTPAEAGVMEGGEAR